MLRSVPAGPAFPFIESEQRHMALFVQILLQLANEPLMILDDENAHFHSR